MLAEHREAAEALLEAHRQAEARHAVATAELRNGYHHVVTACRAAKMPWADIAHALGMPTADAARVRYYRGH